MAIQAGTYQARAVKALLAQVGANRTPAMQVVFQILGDVDGSGEEIRWDGWLTDKTQDRTIEALGHCGWTGDDISVFAVADGPMHGMDLNVVEIVIALEPYDGPNEAHKGKSFPRVQWVNRLGGRGLNVENVMPKAEALSFAEKMKGIVLKSRAKNPPAAAAPAVANGKPAF
jgi:hypothetical protein